MAIVSISRLQQRRGLRADLPANLNEAELGWCLDTRQLFIGNGNTWTGNSEILTQWSDNTELITHVYQGYTGVAANTAVSGSPTVRTLNSILNDTLNVLDYGAVGDGVTDDTAAIQRAISDEWARISLNPTAYQQSRNAIYFPAGTYVISSTILLYPFTTLIGDGQGKTTIQMSSSGTNPILRTADSLGQTGANIGLHGAVVPQRLSVDGITLDGSLAAAGPVVLLQRCRSTEISGEIVNSWDLSQGTGTGKSGIVIQSLGTSLPVEGFFFESLRISDCEYSVYAADPIDNIVLSQTSLYNAWIGAYFGHSVDGRTTAVRVIDNSFYNIDNIGLSVDTTGSVTSVANAYEFTGNVAIAWSSNCRVCSSIGDTFNDSSAAHQVVNNNPGFNLIWNPQQTSLTTNAPVPWSTTILANQIGTATGIVFNISALVNTFSAFIDYGLNLNGYRKTGRLSIVSDGFYVNLTDTYTEINAGAASVTFTAGIQGDDVAVFYTSTGSSPGSMQYIQTYWVA